MFLTCTGGYDRHGQQRARGAFLILFSTNARFTGSDGKAYPVVRAAVRTVAMRQCGHFMMGSTVLGPHRLVLSGSYGSDGLTEDPDKYPGLWDRLYPMPINLAEQYWRGGGHNSAGSEAPALRVWAQAHLPALRKAGR